jgi:uncharacterized protein (TIGR02246 family)
MAIPLVIIFCLTLSCQQQGAEVEKTEADIQSEKIKVQSIIHQYIKALTTKDMELLSEIFSDDEDMVMFDGNISKQFIGWEALKGRFQEHFDSYEELEVAFRDQVVKVHASGEVAWLSCILDANLLVQGQEGRISGLRATWVLEKRNGNWVIVQAHFSLPKAEQEIE